MLRFISTLRRLASLPPNLLWRKAVQRASTAARRRAMRFSDLRTGSYTGEKACGPLARHLDRFPLAEANGDAVRIAAVAAYYLEHRFDLLGSGWTRVYHGMKCRGVEGERYISTAQSPSLADRVNPANRAESQRVRALIESAYEPIDWQLDFKSGYRWREDLPSADIPIPADHHGVDIKMPWELARCQHLPQLALAYGLAAAGKPGFDDAGRYRSEFRNQVLDFIAGNPPRFGVNWSCAMDVGIRAANWLLAYDLFAAAGVRFDGAFERVFARSIYEHGSHIASNLEWNEAFRSNHYLADLVGLLFTGAYLPNSAESDSWIRLAACELCAEIPLQFTEDGANFEGSTAYHRLSTELAVYGLALLASVLRRRLPLPWDAAEYPWSPSRRSRFIGQRTSAASFFAASSLGRLERAAEFSLHASRGDGQIVQIGDNDSGRLFKLQPAYHIVPTGVVRRQFENLAGYAELHDEADYWLEDSLDHRHLWGMVGALFGREDLGDAAGPYRIDASLVFALIRGRTLATYRAIGEPPAAARIRRGVDEDFARIEAHLRESGACDTQTYRFRLMQGSPADRELFAYPDFGLYLFKGRDFFLAIRCGPHGQSGNGGHAHNDQLSLECVAENHAFAMDPGSYLYTALPARRNEYRSVLSHFAPRAASIEPADMSRIFALPDRSRARCLYFGALGFIGMHEGFLHPVYRVVALEKDCVEIRDYAKGFILQRCPFSVSQGGKIQFRGPPFSPGYGSRAR